MNYVGGERQRGCIFCNALAEPDDPESLVLSVGEHAFMLLNRFPYNSGHLMIVPNAHVSSPEELAPEARAEMFEMASFAIEAARRVFRCDGFNMGMNVGAIAGAGIADHLHMHLVPRWTGDANFMPILGDTMVIPEVLPVTRARLRAELETMAVARLATAERAAGALVYLPGRNTFALRRSRSGQLVLPKGHIEEGETAAETALREVLEETGLVASITGWLGSQTIAKDAGNHPVQQHVVFFLASATATHNPSSQPASDVLLVGLDGLIDALDIPALKALVEASMPALRTLVGET